MAECIHLPEQLRLYLYHFFRSPFPWHYGAGIFFKPYMLHCSTSWGGNGSLRYPGTGAFTSPGQVNPNAYVIGGDSSSGYTTRYGGPRHLRREGLWKGYHHFEPGISKTHLLFFNVLKRNGCKTICSTFSTSIEDTPKAFQGV